MKQIDFCNKTRLILAPDEHKKAGKYAAELGNHVLIVYGGGSLKRSGALDTIEASLSQAGVSFSELGGVKGNPDIGLVRQGSRLCQEQKINVILACGGGSVIDTAKGIAMGALYDGDPWDFFRTGQQPQQALPIGVVLTVPASGSESSSGAVISCTDSNEKVLYGSEKIRPAFCIIDPTLFVTLPPRQTFTGVCDMMSHVLERYFSHEGGCDLTDALCEAVMGTIIRSAKDVQRDPHDLNAWSNLALGANLAHNGTCGLGREADWACHFMEHAVSAFYPSVAHGAGLAVLTPAWMEYVYRENIPEFSRFAHRMMQIPGNEESEEAARTGIQAFRNLLTSFGLPASMSDLGIMDDSLFEKIAKSATYYDMAPSYCIGNLKKLSWQDVLAILHLAEKPCVQK